MGTSVYPVVGRVRPDFEGELEVITMLTDGTFTQSLLPQPGDFEPTPIDLQQVVQDPPQHVRAKLPQPQDLIFSYPDNKYQPEHPQNVLTHMCDNSPLFSWLCDIRGDCMPRLDYRMRIERTEAFIDWGGNTPGVTYVDFADHRQKHPKDTLRDHYFDGFYTPIMFTIEELLAFNYDEVALMQTHTDINGDITGQPHPEGKTWRDLFHGKPGRVADSYGYFEFLEEAKTKGWTFVIFCFD